MKTKFSLLFYIRKPKNYAGGPMPIWVRITVKGKRSETPSGRECEPAQWNSAAGRLRGTKEEVIMGDRKTIGRVRTKTI